MLPFETKVIGGAEVRGGGVRENDVVVAVLLGLVEEDGCRDGSSGLFPAPVLASASLIRVCTFDTTTYMYVHMYILQWNHDTLSQPSQCSICIYKACINIHVLQAKMSVCESMLQNLDAGTVVQ